MGKLEVSHSNFSPTNLKESGLFPMSKCCLDTFLFIFTLLSEGSTLESHLSWSNQSRRKKFMLPKNALNRKVNYKTNVNKNIRLLITFVILRNSSQVRGCSRGSSQSNVLLISSRTAVIRNSIKSLTRSSSSSRSSLGKEK
jgi:hypothetical protein